MFGIVCLWLVIILNYIVLAIFQYYYAFTNAPLIPETPHHGIASAAKLINNLHNAIGNINNYTEKCNRINRRLNIIRFIGYIAAAITAGGSLCLAIINCSH